MRYSKLMLSMMLGAMGMQMAAATPTAEEAAQLGKTLTPLGAIKAGNKEGTIPEWTGGVCTPPTGYKPHQGIEAGGAPYIDPFAADKPLFKITAENLAQYADKLDAGTKDLFRRYPKTFFINVYPTRRSACYPNWVYENTIGRVMKPKIVGGNIPSLADAQAQFPFPIPKNGTEAVWNAMVQYDRPLTKSSYMSVYVDSSGQRTMIDSDRQVGAKPFWDNSMTTLPDEKPFHIMSTLKQYPPNQAGNAMLIYHYSRMDLKGDPVWAYIPGQRRVRQAPEFAYDGVAPSAGGTFLYDEPGGFAGKMDKFDFKLLGRKEMYVPYNTSEAVLNRAEAATPNHVDPAAIRFELHRVWHVEATLKPGERHVQKKKVLYIDEDSWMTMVYNGVDHADKVHHHYYFNTAQMYDKQGLGLHAYDSYDLAKGAYTHWMFSGTVGGITSYNTYKMIDPLAPGQFTPEGMAGRGVR